MEFAVIFGGTLIALLLIGFTLLSVFSPARALAERAEAVARRAKRARLPAAVSPARVARGRASTRFQALDKVLRRLLPDPQALARRLERTGRDMTFGGYAACSLGLVAVSGLLVWWFVGLSPLLASLIAVVAGIGIPHWAVGFLGQRRTGKFLATFPGAIELMVRGLRSGLPISECIASVGVEMSDPVGAEFRLVADRVRLGMTLEDSLWETAKRLDTTDFRFFVISLAVQKETGGNLAETLANLADILRKRKQMKLKVKALSSEARASAYILGALPFLMFAILMVINPDYTMLLFTDPRGHMALAAGLGSLFCGVAVMFKMVRFEI